MQWRSGSAPALSSTASASRSTSPRVDANDLFVIPGPILDVGDRPCDKLLFVKREGRKLVAKRSKVSRYELASVNLHRSTKMSWKYSDFIAQGQDSLVQALVEVMSETFRIIGQIRAADALEEQRVAGKDRAIAKLIHGRTLCVPGHADRRDSEVHPGLEFDGFAVHERFIFESKGIGWIEPQRRTTLGRQLAGTAYVIGVQVRVQAHE